MRIQYGQKLIWDDRYSVGVELIDSQHKIFFSIINELIDSIKTKPNEVKIAGILEQLIDYTKFHFATEERYFKEFDYEKTDDHVAKHHYLNAKLREIMKENKNDVFTLAFELVDFLEDWLINHIMSTDQEYKECFKTHGLK